MGEQHGLRDAAAWLAVQTRTTQREARRDLALANPARHTDAGLRDDSGDGKPLRRRLGEAFVEYVERYPLDATPQTAGVNATIVVTMTLEQLMAEHATALLDDGSRMTAGQARRLACETSASGCHAHHDDPWSRLGLTDLANGRLLCPRHHRLAHDPRFAMTVHADNKVTFARRT